MLDVEKDKERIVFEMESSMDELIHSLFVEAAFYSENKRNIVLKLYWKLFEEP